MMTTNGERGDEETRARLHRDDDNDYTPTSSLPAATVGLSLCLRPLLCRRLCARTFAYTYVCNGSAVRPSLSFSLSLTVSRVSCALVRAD